MKHNYHPLSFKRLNLFALFLLLFGSTGVIAQTNVALTAQIVQTGTGGNASCATANYSSCLYNNNLIPGYNSSSAAGNWGFVNTGGNITFYWLPGTQPLPNTVSKMVFYKDFRPLLSANIEYWDGTAWVLHAVYDNQENSVNDSVLFTPIPIVTDSIRINNINLGYVGANVSNPNFREIQIWSLPACSGTPVTNIQARYNGNVVLAPVTNVCVGNMVYLNATSANLTGGHKYEWQRSASSTGPWTPIAGATDAGYAAEAFGTHYYRVIDSCLISLQNSPSNAIQVTAATPVYQTVNPTYFQNFQTWTTACAIAPFANDVPGPGWSNTPPNGFNTWRENTTTVAASGWNSVSNAYTPTAIPVIGTTDNKSARAHTSGMVPGTAANLNLHLNLTNPAGGKQLYFYMINTGSGIPGGDSLKVQLSTDDGASWTTLGTWDTAAAWRRRSVPLNTNASNAILRFQGSRTHYLTNSDASDIGIDSVYIVGPCSGMPSAGNIPLAATVFACPGATYNLTPNGTTMAGGLVYTWQVSTNGCVSFTDVPGADAQNFITPPIYDTLCYRLQVSCGTNTAYSNVITFNVPEPQYAQIPFSESFETWITRCATSNVPAPCSSCLTEVPGVNWVNSPVTGNNSWRRNDQGASAAWSAINNGAVNPAGSPGTPTSNYAARFHSEAPVANGVTGSLDLMVDCSSSTGNKELHFDMYKLNGNDSLRIWLSTNGGLSFTRLTSFNTTTGWESKLVQVPSNSNKTIIRFQGYSDGGNLGSDIYVDRVVVLPPCLSTPNPGTISTAAPCPGVNFTMNLVGNTQAAGLTYQWYDSVANGVWTPITGATNTSYTTNILNNTCYKVIVTCVNTGVSVSTPVQCINLASFYYCYCGSTAQVSNAADIGNFTVRSSPSLAQLYSNGTASPQINNGSANGTYSDYRFTQAPIPMYHDSSYKLIVAQINSGAFTAATVSIWIDTNRNGVFDPNEKFMHETTSASSNPSQVVDSIITIPAYTKVGVTGLRIIMESPTTSTPAPCGPVQSGEVEDYLVDIRYPQCDGPTNAGVAFASDSSGCVGYNITVIDTTHEHKRHNIFWVWQYSPDGNSWANVPGSEGRDTVNQVLTGPTYFRLRMLCIKGFTIDTTYSNTVSITINPPYACYCYSIATGGNQDSSDIGAFTLDNFTINQGGPHLLNGQAYRSRTDYTKMGNMELWTNETYSFLFYHIMRGGVHADAKLTLFMDFNNDLQYNVTPNYSELIWTGISTASNFALAGTVTIPPYAIPNVKTGMRLIINNDIGPNVPSDMACGTYFSGETEDYVVTFRDSTTSVDPVGNVTQLYLYPNPTEGRFTVTFTALKTVEHATLTVTNLTGQKIMQKEFANAGREFTREIDLTGVAKGFYLVELQADNEKLVRKVIVR